VGCYCRYFSDITLYGLEVLQLVTLSPLPRRAIIAAGGSSSSSGGGSRGGQAGSSRSGMATLLHAASTGNAQPFYGLADPEVCLCLYLLDVLRSRIPLGIFAACWHLPQLSACHTPQSVGIQASFDAISCVCGDNESVYQKRFLLFTCLVADRLQVIATALHVIVNCVTAPPSLAYLLPPPGSAAGKQGSTICRIALNAQHALYSEHS
jgi:hypothetical protein